MDLQKRPIQDVIGIVSEIPNEVMFGFRLYYWKFLAGEVKPRYLQVVLNYDAPKDAMRQKFAKHSIVHVRLRISELEDSALWVETVGFARDAELTRKAADLIRPLSFVVDPYGVFKCDRKIAIFFGTVRWTGEPVKLALDIDAEDLSRLEDAEITQELATLVKGAHAILNDQDKWDQAVREFAAEELLGLAIAWQDDGDLEWNKDDFVQLITLETIWLKKDGIIDFWFSDGDMFLGHQIWVQGHVESGLKKAKMT